MTSPGGRRILVLQPWVELLLLPWCFETGRVPCETKDTIRPFIILFNSELDHSLQNELQDLFSKILA